MIEVLLIIINISFYFGGFQIFAIGNYGITAADLCNAAMIIIIIKKLFWNNLEIRIAKNPAIIFVLILILLTYISGYHCYVSSNKAMQIQFLKTSSHFLFILSFVLICIIYPFRIKNWDYVLKTLLIFSIFINLFAIYQLLARAYDLPFAWIELTNVSFNGRSADSQEAFNQLSLGFGSYFRATSIFSEPSALGSFNIQIILLSIIPWVQKKEHFFKSKILTITILILAIISLFLTFSLTGYLGLILILIGILIFESSKIKNLLKFLSIITALIIITNIFIESNLEISIVDLVTKRIQGIVYSQLNINTEEEVGMVGESFGSRVGTAKGSVEIWKSYPLTGIGLGLTYTHGIEDMSFSDYTILSALAELGIFGALAFIGLFASLFIYTGRFVIKRKLMQTLPIEHQRVAGIMFYFMIVLFVINFISGNALVAFTLWLPMGMVLSVTNITLKSLNNTKIYRIRLLKKSLKARVNEAFAKYWAISAKEQ